MRSSWPLVAILLLAPTVRADEVRDPDVGKSYHVPYHRSATQHVIVRAKINGKGPYHFLIDTGAPMLYVATELCQKLHVKPDKYGWGTFDRFEIEGGIVLNKFKGRVEDPFQLEGMNGMGLAGVHLDGVIGYTVLARYRLEFDFTKDKMTWTRLAFNPPVPQALGGGGGMPAGLNAMGTIMKTLGTLMGRDSAPHRVGRGFLGVELAEADGRVTVRTVLKESPAAKAGLHSGDRITAVGDKEVKSLTGLRRALAKRTAGESVSLTVERDGQSQAVTVRAGEGF